MKRKFKNWKSGYGAAQRLLLTAASVVALSGLVPAMAGAVEIDRITVVDPATSAIKFKVTSEGNVTAASYTGDGAGLANVPHWKGAWSGATAYAKDDCVFYGGSSWIALAASNNAQPDVSPLSWAIFAQQGPPGTSGAQGIQGVAGPQGPAGSPDSQSQIFGKIAAQADGAALAVQQGAAEAATAVKLSVKDVAGRQTFAVKADGAITSEIPSSGSAVAHAFDTANNLISSGDKLLVVRNAGQEVLALNANNAAAQGPNLTFATNGLTNLVLFAATGTTNLGWRPVLKGIRSRGTVVAPEGVLAGDMLFSFLGSGYDSTRTEQVTGAFDFIADENFTGAANAGTSFRIALRKSGETSRTVRFVVANDGNTGIGATIPTQKLEVNGGIRMNTTAAKPVCSAGTRGTTWITQGGSGVKDTMEICAKDAADAYAWRTIW